MSDDRVTPAEVSFVAASCDTTGDRGRTMNVIWADYSEAEWANIQSWRHT